MDQVQDKLTSSNLQFGDLWHQKTKLDPCVVLFL